MKYLLAFFFLHENIFETITYIDIKYVDSKDKPFFKKKKKGRKVGLIRKPTIKFTFYTRMLLLIFRIYILIVLTTKMFVVFTIWMNWRTYLFLLLQHMSDTIQQPSSTNPPLTDSPITPTRAWSNTHYHTHCCLRYVS